MESGVLTKPDLIAPLDITSEEQGTAQAQPVAKPKSPGKLRRAGARIASGINWLFGAASMIVGLALLSVIPVLNMLSLGYLLEVSGRVARSGRIRSGFIGVRKAAVLGRMVLGAWLVMWPVRFISSMWKDAELIAPGSPNAQTWRIGLVIVTILAVWHIAWACLRGGRARHFLWPAPLAFFKWLSRPGRFEETRNAIVDYLSGLRLPYYFWLGARGFVGAAAWLIVPVSIFLLASRLPVGGAAILSLFGALLLGPVVFFLPFLQARFALTNRFKALFELGEVRRLFLRAPLAWWMALLITLLFALPLYLLKIELTPKEVAWLPSLVFVVFIFPARLLTGWALGRAVRHETPRHFIFRWMSRLAAIPVVAFYVIFVYVTQYLSWHGGLSLFEQHAFLVPAPLMGL